MTIFPLVALFGVFCLLLNETASPKEEKKDKEPEQEIKDALKTVAKYLLEPDNKEEKGKA
ncbi:MAG: hypothetical protein WA919_00370 [Coleofasciculaceae cyanobacterium]